MTGIRIPESPSVPNAHTEALRAGFDSVDDPRDDLAEALRCSTLAMDRAGQLLRDIRKLQDCLLQDRGSRLQLDERHDEFAEQRVDVDLLLSGVQRDLTDARHQLRAERQRRGVEYFAALDRARTTDRHGSLGAVGASDRPARGHLVPQDLLDYVSSRNLLDGAPGQVSTEHGGNGLAASPCDEHAIAAGRLPAWVSAHAFEVLLDRATDVERQLAERRYVHRSGISYGIATTVDDDGDLVSGMSAVIDHDRGAVIINLERPAVGDVVLGDPQRPLRDRVRVASELVRIYRDAVCLLSLPESIRGRVVGGLREAVAVLRQLISADSNSQPDHARQGTDGAGNSDQRISNSAHSSPSSVGSTPSVGETPGPGEEPGPGATFGGAR